MFYEVAAPQPRFRESSLRSRPKGINRITHTTLRTPPEGLVVYGLSL